MSLLSDASRSSRAAVALSLPTAGCAAPTAAPEPPAAEPLPEPAGAEAADAARPAL